MDHVTYRGLTERRLHGRKLRLVEPVITRGGLHYPAGTVMEFARKHGGFNLVGSPCTKCGVRPALNQVSPALVELLDDDDLESLEEPNPGMGPWLP